MAPQIELTRTYRPSKDVVVVKPAPDFGAAHHGSERGVRHLLGEPAERRIPVAV